MTGEMSYINQETGEDSNGDFYPVHLAIANALDGELKPFDIYQGPYVKVGNIRLWIFNDNDGELTIYREDNEQSIKCGLAYWGEIAEELAVNAAKELVK